MKDIMTAVYLSVQLQYMPPCQWYLLGMCISITTADAIQISMHSQLYDTLKIQMKQLAIRYDSHLLRCSAIQFRFGSTQCDSMQYTAMEKI